MIKECIKMKRKIQMTINEEISKNDVETINDLN